MNDRLVFALSESEAVASGHIVSARQVRATGISYSFAAVLGAAPLIGLGLAAAYTLNLVPGGQLGPLMVGSVLGYFSGLFVGHFEVKRASRQHYRELHRRNRVLTDEREVTIAPDGLCLKMPMIEVRYAWNSVSAVEERGLFVLIWIGTMTAIAIPRRLFASSSECDAYVTRISGLAKLDGPKTA
jgi:hypothetical protein